MYNKNNLDCLSYNTPVRGVDNQLCVTTSMDEKGRANTINSYSNCGIIVVMKAVQTQIVSADTDVNWSFSLNKACPQI